MPDEVLIVGAGPTGLTAAVELARRGVLPRVIERRDALSPLSRAVGLLPASMEILEAGGAAAAIRAEAVALRRAVFHRGARPVATLPLRPGDGRRLLALPQDRTEAHLLAAFERRGGRVEFGRALEALEQDADGVRVVIGGRQGRVARVLGADGAHSTVRAALGLPFDGLTLDGDWSIADVDSPDWPLPEDFAIYLLPGGDACIVVPLAAGRYRVIATGPEALPMLPVPMTVARLRRAGAFRIMVRQVPEYGRGAVQLAGDAAHVHSPVGGRGMNLGIADAADWAARLDEGRLEGYSAARHAAGRATIRLSEFGRRTLLTDGPRRRAALAVLALADLVPALGRRIAGRILAS
ncbi:NAD(P)-binding protein [Rhodobacteraceae bacterium 2CG4]|uniref:NAD(P)-binding protein n=1 Tax=Halovulum marinum TaxID=2662447 RepID=A0A6L5YYU0_9RHOB|nr:FAD-dependent monooxygenase [Halovulum marinum]MSU89481.1 NAD(P)-binding protein [Halovulum marinum]